MSSRAHEERPQGVNGSMSHHDTLSCSMMLAVHEAVDGTMT